MRTNILLSSLLLFSSIAFAGARSNLIECSNTDKSFELKGTLPGAIYDLNLDVKVKGLFEGRLYDEFNDKTNNLEGNASIEQFDAVEDRVFAVTITKKVDGSGTIKDPQVSIALHGIPSTFRKRNEGRDATVIFSAKAVTYIFPSEKLTSSSKISQAICKVTYKGL